MYHDTPTLKIIKSNTDHCSQKKQDWHQRSHMHLWLRKLFVIEFRHLLLQPLLHVSELDFLAHQSNLLIDFHHLWTCDQLYGIGIRNQANGDFYFHFQRAKNQLSNLNVICGESLKEFIGHAVLALFGFEGNRLWLDLNLALKIGLAFDFLLFFFLAIVFLHLSLHLFNQFFRWVKKMISLTMEEFAYIFPFNLVPDDGFAMCSFKNGKHRIFPEIFQFQARLPQNVLRRLPCALLNREALPFKEILESF